MGCDVTAVRPWMELRKAGYKRDIASYGRAPLDGIGQGKVRREGGSGR